MLQWGVCNYLILLCAHSAVRIKIAFPWQGKSNHQTDHKLEFLRHSNSFGIRKKQNYLYAYTSPKSREKDTMSCVKNSTALGI